MKITSFEIDHDHILLVIESRVHSSYVGVPSSHETGMYILDFSKSELHPIRTEDLLVGVGNKASNNKQK